MIRSVRVLIVEDQVLMRQGLRTLLELEDGVEIVGEAADGVEALESVPSLRPDVALVDVRMPRMDGIELVRRLSTRHPEIIAIILTTFDDDEYVFEGLRSGARGYVLKDTPSEHLASVIQRAYAGEAILDGQLTLKLVSEFKKLSGNPARPATSTEALSERELEVLRLVASGAANREIAKTLYITEGTVKNHVTSVLRKLGLRDRTQAALYAADHGWVERS